MTYDQNDVKRRRAERRRAIRRRRIIKGLISFFIISIIVFAVLCITVLFPVKRVSVMGSNMYTPNQISSASGITQKTNMFLVSADSLTEKVRLKLPFVDSIKVKRDFPDRLILTVSDAKEYATIKYGNEYYTVSKKGFVLKKYGEKPENIFEVICNPDSLSLGTSAKLKDENQAALIEEIVKNLEAKQIKIDYVDVTDTVNIKAKICGRFLVNFGTNTNIDKKVAHLNGMVQKIDESKTGKINLSMWTSQKTEGSFVESDIN